MESIGMVFDILQIDTDQVELGLMQDGRFNKMTQEHAQKFCCKKKYRVFYIEGFRK